MAYPVIQSGLSGLAAGDLMIIVGAALSAAEPNIAVVNSTGWTTFASQQPGGGGGTSIFYKYADAADVTNAGSIGLSYDNGSSSASVLNQKLFRITGMVPAATPLGSFANSLSATPTTASVTPLSQDLLLIITANASSGAGRTVSAQAIAANNPSWTELVDSTQSGTGGTFNASISLAYAGQIGAANVATGVGSATISSTVPLGVIALFAIQPQPIIVTIFGSTFGIPAITLFNKILVAVFGPVFTALTAIGAGTLVSKWRNQQKHTTAVVHNRSKS